LFNKNKSFKRIAVLINLEKYFLSGVELMKNSEIALAIILILITMFVFITFFVGWGAFGFGNSANKYYSPPPPSNATLWDKAEWEKYHGNVYQCGFFAEPVAPLMIFPSTNSTISKVSIRFAPAPGEPPRDVTNITYTLSTAYAIKTVRYDDPSINLTYGYWDGKGSGSQQSVPRDYLFEQNEDILVELNTEKMGFTSSTFGPNQRFVLAITPPDECFRALEIRGTTPAEFSQGIPIEISR
jgi:hypothetical protein